MQADLAGISEDGPGWHQCRQTWAASTWSCTGRHNNQQLRQGTALCFWGRLRKQAPCSVQCIIKHLSIVNGWPVDPLKAKPFRCALEIADSTKTQANGLLSPNAMHSKLNKALG